jgi:hypothetical protein
MVKRDIKLVKWANQTAQPDADPIQKSCGVLDWGQVTHGHGEARRVDLDPALRA